MKIAIICAMEEELSEILKICTIKETITLINTDFYIGMLNNKNIVLVKCGIGKVNSAICTQILIDKFNANLVINIGVAGSLSSTLNIGDFVISKQLIYHDFDTNNGIGIIPRMENSVFSADENLINITKKVCDEVLVNNKCYIGNIATGDIFVQSKGLKEKISNILNCLCVEMEGCAIAHTCYLNKIPFVVIRSISDNADELAENSFDEFVVKSSKDFGKIVKRCI